MSETKEQTPEAAAEADAAWAESMANIVREVVNGLPDDATLGELVEATRASPEMRGVLKYVTVQQLIEMACTRPAQKRDDEFKLDADGNPILELNEPTIVRRRADVPDGELRILRALASPRWTKGAMGESQLLRATSLTSEQLRLLLRALKTKGYVHLEGSGSKRKIKITRSGGSHLRRQSRKDG